MKHVKNLLIGALSLVGIIALAFLCSKYQVVAFSLVFCIMSYLLGALITGNLDEEK